MTTSSDEGATLTEEIRRTAALTGFAGFIPTNPFAEDEPLTFLAPSGREYTLELRVLDVTGYRDER